VTAAAGAAPEQPTCVDLDGKRTCCELFGTGARETICLLNGLATSVRDIATPPGLSIGSVCHHCPDKETVFQEEAVLPGRRRVRASIVPARNQAPHAPL